MQTPLITVGIPSYNHAKFLTKCLESVVTQTYSNLEVIVVDNYSTDNTNSILSSFRDPRISIVKVKREGGSIGKSRNAILNKSHGEWIAFLDSDDWWAEDKLKKCASYFQVGVDLIYHDLIVVDETTHRPQSKRIKSRILEKPVFKDLIINGNTIATSSVVVRNTTLRKVNGMSESEEMFGLEDFNTWLKISQITEGFKHIPENLGFYRMHTNNVSLGKKFIRPTAAFIEFLPLLSKKEISVMNNNYDFAAARLNFNARNGNTSRRDLARLIKHGSLKNRLKALYMLLASILNMREK
jgi:glycosyltransferase involved in cell wall biosynthesis